MRFERREAGERIEFWVFDVDELLRPALAAMWWETGRGGGWRRVFASPQPHQADRAFENLQRLLEPALRQAVRIDYIPWQDALADVCGRFGSAGVDWWLAGSAALAVRGAPITPGDLDLIVSGADSCRAGDLLLDGLIEPVTRGEWDLSEWWGRAFVGARVEWAGGITAAADEPEVTDFGLSAAAALDTVRWRNWDIRCRPCNSSGPSPCGAACTTAPRSSTSSVRRHGDHALRGQTLRSTATTRPSMSASSPGIGV